ncbi:hypothetical protein [Geodermatophilus sp. CPCC 205506]|uniref:hypothetical protein n=1 Tax=Geodermatophilus sp. CPCC 205506 TaxID=2936596 RepID=UPI003EE8B055
MNEVGVSQSRQEWGRAALLAATVSAAGVFAQTLLFLVDAVEILPGNPPFRETGAGRDVDLAAFFVALAERQHDIAWNIALRDVLGPIAAIALIVLARAWVRLRGDGRAGVESWALVISIGALLKALADLVYVSQLGLWRDTGFTAEPPADIIAVGRTSEAITDLADHLEYAAFLTLAAGLAGLAVHLGRRLRLLALATALGLVVSTVAALTRSEAVYDIASLLTGALLAPVLLLGLGRSLARSTAVLR